VFIYAIVWSNRFWDCLLTLFIIIYLQRRKENGRYNLSIYILSSQSMELNWGNLRSFVRQMQVAERLAILFVRLNNESHPLWILFYSL